MSVKLSHYLNRLDCMPDNIQLHTCLACQQYKYTQALEHEVLSSGCFQFRKGVERLPFAILGYRAVINSHYTHEYCVAAADVWYRVCIGMCTESRLASQ